MIYSLYDDVKILNTPCIYYLFNDRFETTPSLLGDNLVDLIYQALDLGMDYFCARYYNSSGVQVLEKYRIVSGKKGEPPSLIRIY